MKPRTTCCQRNHNNSRSSSMNPNTSSNSFSTRLEEQWWWTISLQERTSLTSVSNITTTWLKTWRSGTNSFSSTVTSTMLGNQRTRNTKETSLLEKSLTGRCLLITLPYSRVRWTTSKTWEDSIPTWVLLWIKVLLFIMMATRITMINHSKQMRVWLLAIDALILINHLMSSFRRMKSNLTQVHKELVRQHNKPLRRTSRRSKRE